MARPAAAEPLQLGPELDWHRAGARHERLLALAGGRKRGGVYYTPADVVDHLLDLALDPLLDACGDSIERVRALRVLDPASGSGNFLSAAGDRICQRLAVLGLPGPEAAALAYGECLVGIDIDPAAVDLCVASLVHASHGSVTADALRGRIFCADALDAVADEDGVLSSSMWRRVKEDVGAADGFHLVVGNPPFLSQLASGTARSKEYTSRLRQRFGSSVAGLTDTAMLFLLLAVDTAKADDGVVCLIQPISVLSTRDAADARRAVLERAGMRAAWICEDQVFDASVRVCAPLLVRGEAPPAVQLLHNRAFAPAGSVAASSLREATWSTLLAAIKRVPDRVLRSHGSVRDIASATADFRDHYYGMRGCVVDLADAEDTEFPPLATSGLIDPAHALWGSRSTKFDKASYQFPRVDLSRLEPRLRDWARRRLAPKLLLATQTKVLEALVDEHGRFVPSVPVITITADDVADLWRLGALLSSPPVTLVAARRHMGAALNSEALKLSASDVLDLPLPSEPDAWTEAADHFRRASATTAAGGRSTELASAATLMCEAFGLKEDAELMAWWSDRLPAPRADP